MTSNTASTLQEEVYLKLSEDILSGELCGGEALTESHLCSKYNASRTPVRSALHRLDEDGLVKCTPNKGAIVVGINAEKLLYIYQIRMRLEGLASALATEKITAEELATLKETIELSEFYASKGDIESLRRLDTKFHEIIYKASGNGILAKTLGELHRMIKAYRKKSLTVSDRLFKTVMEHREIFEAIKAGQKDEADRLTSEHIKRALDNILTTLGK